MTGKVFPGRVIFDHLPKTSGVAISAWLRSVLGSGCVSPNLMGNHADLIRMHGGAYSLISAHVAFSVGDKLDPRYQYITLLRDPIDRVVSWLFFVMNTSNKSLDSYGLKAAARSFFESDGRDYVPEQLHGMNNPYVEHFCAIGGVQTTDEEKRLQMAVAAIKQYNVVGIYEEYSAFTAAVAQLLHIPAPAEVSKVNVTARRPRVSDISQALMERIIALNSLDLRLYSEISKWTRLVQLERSSIAHPEGTFEWIKYELAPTLITNTAGSIKVEESPTALQRQEQTTIRANVMNRSSQDWVGHAGCPVNASYHWLTVSGEKHIYSGRRTPIPAGGVLSGDTRSIDIAVVAPNEPGRYALVLTLVQEGVCWFEERGFRTATLEIDVV